MVTIKDIAKQLQLHHTTVSKALHDHPDIKNETRERVKALAKKLDYHPNMLAQNFKRRTSNTIAVIVPSINVDFFSNVISAIEVVAYDAGYTILISQSNESLKREALIARSMLANQVAGLIISVSSETQKIDHLQKFYNHNIPVIFFDRLIPNLKAAKVSVDDYAAAVKVVEHLIERGHEKIAHLGAPETVTVSANRYKGYIKVLKKHKLPIEERWIRRTGFREVDGYEGMMQILKKRPYPSAVFAVNDPAAIGAYKAIKEHGLRIPEDIAVAAFGNVRLAGFMDPPLTTVAQNPIKMGQECANLMLSAIQNSDSDISTEERFIPTRLIIRGST